MQQPKLTLPYRCKMCDRRFSMLSELQAHVLAMEHDDYEIIEIPG